MALLVNGAGQEHADNDGGPAVDVVQHLVTRERLAIERVDEMGRTFGNSGSRARK